MNNQTQIATATLIEASSPPDAGNVHRTGVRRALTSPVAALPGKPAVPARKRPANTNVLALLYHGLRGKFALAAVLGVLVGGAGAFTGWKLGRPVYHSESLLRVAYTMPKVFESTDQNEPMGQMFDTYMQSQKLLIGSRRVIDMALMDPAWEAAGRAVPANPDEYFTDNLEVVIQPRSEFILISVTDPDPRTAAAAARAIASAYAKLYHGQDEQREMQRTRELERREEFLQKRLTHLHNQIRQVATKYGTTALDALHDAVMVRVARYETARADVRLAMLATAPPADAGATSASGFSPAPTTAPSADIPPEPERPQQTPQQIALIDPVMRGYLDDQDAVEKELLRLAAYGYGPSHMQVITTSRALDEAKARVRRYAEMPRPSVPGPAQALAGGVALPLTTAGKPIEALKQDEIIIRGFLGEAKAELAAIGIDRLGLRQLEGEVASSQLELDQVSRRVTSLRGEAALGGRLNIVSLGEVPVSPDRDPRRKMAAVGLLAGACAPAALLMLLPFVRPRYRYHDEAQKDLATRIPLLGILPTLKPGPCDTPEMSRAAHSLHQLRVTLQAQTSRDGCRSYLVSSASAGEGKTSLTMALGLSFAASHMRTLLIDGDIVGRGLTSGLEAAQVKGLYEALAAGNLRGLVRRTAGGVHVLCAGNVGSADACGLSPAGVGALLEQARRHFDVVLIDSGPVMGSVEAAVFAPEVDGVIFTIARGQRPAVVQQAQQRLDALGARIAGVVFNRARPKDFHSSPFGSSSASSSSQASEPVVLPETAKFARFGPLVQAVACGMPTLHP